MARAIENFLSKIPLYKKNWYFTWTIDKMTHIHMKWKVTPQVFNFIAWITGKPQLVNCFKETRFPFPLLPGNDSHFTHEFSWILSVVINCEVPVVKIAWFQQVRVCDDSVYYPRLKFKFKVISQIKHIWHLLSILTRTQWMLWAKHKLWNLSCKAKHYSVREWS